MEQTMSLATPKYQIHTNEMDSLNCRTAIREIKFIFKIPPNLRPKWLHSLTSIWRKKITQILDNVFQELED